MPVSKITAALPAKDAKDAEDKCANIVEALVKTRDALVAELDEVKKSGGQVPEIAKEEERLRKLVKGRGPELEDLKKAMKKRELHTNPAKLKRLIDDLNDDVTKTNALAAGVDAALEKHFSGELAKLVTEIEKTLPKGLTTALFSLPQRVEAFKKKNAKEHWANFKTNSDTFAKKCEKDALEAFREQSINVFNSGPEFRPLKADVRDRIVQAGIKEGSSPAEVKAKLEAAFETQDKPTKARWASFLKLGAGGSYKLNPAGAYRGNAIHWTMSNDSWTKDADGGVSIKDNSVDQLYEKLLKSTPGKQVHATLEIGDSKSYPHVFLFAGVLSGDKKWEAARAANNFTKDWVTGGQKALSDVLATIETDIKKKLKEAKDRHGANF